MQARHKGGETGERGAGGEKERERERERGKHLHALKEEKEK
jgi:hypothetical protein